MQYGVFTKGTGAAGGFLYQTTALGGSSFNQNALDTAYANFETVVDPDLIDCYTYEIYSVQKRYKFLLEQAKQMDLQTFF